MKGRKLWTSLIAGFFILTLFTGSAFAEKILKFGVLGPFTGPSAKTGSEFKDSVNMALQKIHYKVGDYTLKPVWIDSQSDPAKAVSAYAEACERIGIQAGILNWHSSVAVACMDVAAKYKVPHMFSFGATEVVNKKWRSDPEKYSYWGGKGWPVPAKLETGYAAAVNDAVKTGRFKPKSKVIAIACEDTDWGHSAGDAVAAEFKKDGWKVASEDYFALTQTDFYTLLSKYKSEHVSVIFSTSTAAPVTTAFIKQIRDVGLKSLVIIDGLGWSGNWYKMAGAASNGVLDMIPQLATPEAKAWAAQFQKQFGMKPSPSAAGLSYDYTNFFIKVLQHTYKQYGKLDKKTIYKVMANEVDTGKLIYTRAEGAIIMKEYKYTKQSMPDPVVGEDYYFFPVIQYENGVGKIVFPENLAQTQLAVPK